MMDVKAYAQFCNRYQSSYKALMERLDNFDYGYLPEDYQKNEHLNTIIQNFFHLDGLMEHPEYLHLMLKEKDFFDFLPTPKIFAYSFISCWPGDYQLSLLFAHFTDALDANMLSLLKTTGEDDYFKQALKGNHQFVYYLGQEMLCEHFDQLDMLQNHLRFSILKQPGNIMPAHIRLGQGGVWRYISQLGFDFQASDMIALNYSIEKEQFLDEHHIALPDSQKVAAMEQSLQKLIDSPYGREQAEYQKCLDQVKVYKKRLLYGKLDDSLQEAILFNDMAPEHKLKL